jgi:broad specificity phosphatase PhoE
MFFLVRHASHDDLGARLTGRLPGRRLNEAGRKEASRLAERLCREAFDVVHTSPRERARETAQAIAEASGTSGAEMHETLDEVNFGAWSGADFQGLSRDPAWQRWNEERSLARTPGGEDMLDVQARISRHMEGLASALPQGAAVLVSHAEVIRAAVFRHLGISLDLWARLEISPASITRIVVGAYGAKVLGINEVSA